MAGAVLLSTAACGTSGPAGSSAGSLTVWTLQDSALNPVQKQQIDAFKVQHGQVPPQNGTLWAILQRTSDAAETATARPVGTRLGPYFHGDPMNPWNNLTRVSSAEVDSGAGWYYVATPGAYELRLRNGDGSINRQY